MRYGWVRALCLSMRVHALVSCVCALSQNKMCAIRVMGCNGISECNSRCVWGLCTRCVSGFVCVLVHLCVCAFWGVCVHYVSCACVFVWECVSMWVCVWGLCTRLVSGFVCLLVHAYVCVCVCTLFEVFVCALLGLRCVCLYVCTARAVSVCVHCIRGVCIGWEIAGRSRAPWQQVCGGDMDTLSLDLSVAIDLSPSYLAAAKTHRSLLTEANYTSLQHHHTKQNKANTSV
jgi:hypothetical protein